jgi:SAM-dependent methyltransferase
MNLFPDGIDSLLQLRRWFRRRVLRLRPYMDGSPYLHETLLLDKIRCDAYRDAIRRTVKPGDVVVDLGAGTGLLSFFAAQAGARRVYAIEVSPIASLAAELIKANGFDDLITLIRKDSRKTRLPERCDVLVTETLSPFCFDTEEIIESVADARERFLKPGGKIIPESANTFLLPFSSDDFGAFSSGAAPGKPFYGLDFRPFAKKVLNGARLVRASGKPFLPLSDPASCYHLDFRTVSGVPGPILVPFRLTAGGRLDGFLGWFQAHLCPGVAVSNSPFLPLTSWRQIYFPVPEQPHYHSGQALLLSLDPRIVAGEAQWAYALQTVPQ